MSSGIYLISSSTVFPFVYFFLGSGISSEKANFIYPKYYIINEYNLNLIRVHLG